MFIKLARVGKKPGFFVQFRQKEVLKFYTTDMKGFSDFRNYGKTEKRQAVLRTIRRMPAFAVFYSKEAISG